MQARHQVLGVVRSVHPAKRSLRVEVAAGREDALAAQTHLALRLRDASIEAIRVVKTDTKGSTCSVVVHAGLPRERLMALRGAEILGTADAASLEMPARAREVIGFRVRWTTVRGQAREAEAQGVYESPAQDTLVLRDAHGHEHLLPFVSEWIAQVDAAAREIQLRAEPPSVEDDDACASTS